MSRYYQEKRRNAQGMVSDAADIVAVVNNRWGPIIVGAPRGFNAVPLVELYVGGSIYNLTAEQAEQIGEALIAASLKAGAPE